MKLIIDTVKGYVLSILLSVAIISTIYLIGQFLGLGECPQKYQYDKLVKREIHTIVDSAYIHVSSSSIRKVDTKTHSKSRKKNTFYFGSSWDQDHIFYKFSVGDSICKTRGETLLYIYEDINDPEGMNRLTSTNNEYRLKGVIDFDTVFVCPED